jgi:hypothetical protein
LLLLETEKPSIPEAVALDMERRTEFEETLGWTVLTVTSIDKEMFLVFHLEAQSSHPVKGEIWNMGTGVL